MAAKRAKRQPIMIATIEASSFLRKRPGKPRVMEICFKDTKTGQLHVEQIRVGEAVGSRWEDTQYSVIAADGSLARKGTRITVKRKDIMAKRK